MMTIPVVEFKQNNLFRNGAIVLFEPEQEMALLRDKIKYTAGITDNYYTVRKDDRLDIIAWKYYRDIVEDASKFWWVIADANNIYNPLDISDLLGKEILIPNLLNVLLVI